MAKQMNADVVIIDENAGYQIARHFGLPVVRTLSILKVAKDKKIINKIRPIVEQMVQRGRWYSKNVIDKIILLARLWRACPPLEGKSCLIKTETYKLMSVPKAPRMA